MLATLRNGQLIDDVTFDEIYSPKARCLSPYHWTPVAVAAAAAKLLVRDEQAQVLDVGSGVGKFCLVGAAVTPGTFHGVERRADLADEARRVLFKEVVGRVHFVVGDALEIDWSAFDGIYLFNPFYEYVEPMRRIDGSLRIDWSLHASCVAATSAKLQMTRPGTRVVTYHGFGGAMPLEFKPYFSMRCGGDFLRAWVKTTPLERTGRRLTDG